MRSCLSGRHAFFNARKKTAMKKSYSLLLLLSIFLLPGCYKLRGYYGTKSYEPVTRPVRTPDIQLPEGYSIEMVSAGLNFPTDVTFDDQGNVYAIEAGYSYGEIYTTP